MGDLNRGGVRVSGGGSASLAKKWPRPIDWGHKHTPKRDCSVVGLLRTVERSFVVRGKCPFWTGTAQFIRLVPPQCDPEGRVVLRGGARPVFVKEAGKIF